MLPTFATATCSIAKKTPSDFVVVDLIPGSYSFYDTVFLKPKQWMALLLLLSAPPTFRQGPSMQVAFLVISVILIILLTYRFTKIPKNLLQRKKESNQQLSGITRGGRKQLSGYCTVVHGVKRMSRIFECKVPNWRTTYPTRKVLLWSEDKLNDTVWSKYLFYMSPSPCPIGLRSSLASSNKKGVR